MNQSNLTPAEIAQVEAAKEALGKATPGPWLADIRGGCLAVYQESKQDQTPGCHRDDERNIYYSNKGAFFNGLHWTMDEQARIDATLIAAAPVLVRRVIELEKRIAWLERLCRMVNIPEGLLALDGLEKPTQKDIEIALRLITEAQGGEG